MEYYVGVPIPFVLVLFVSLPTNRLVLKSESFATTDALGSIEAIFIPVTLLMDRGGGRNEKKERSSPKHCQAVSFVDFECRVREFQKKKKEKLGGI